MILKHVAALNHKKIVLASASPPPQRDPDKSRPAHSGAPCHIIPCPFWVQARSTCCWRRDRVPGTAQNATCPRCVPISGSRCRVELQVVKSDCRWLNQILMRTWRRRARAQQSTRWRLPVAKAALCSLQSPTLTSSLPQTQCATMFVAAYLLAALQCILHLACCVCAVPLPAHQHCQMPVS